MSNNPYAPPLLPATKVEKVPDKGIRPLAILAGIVTDIGCSLVAGIVISVVMTVIVVGGGGGVEELQGWFSSLNYLLVGLAVGLGFTLLGGFVAGIIAKQSEVLHGGVVGLIGAIFGVLFWAFSPAWYNLVSLCAVIPTASCGGYLASLLRRRSAGNMTSNAA